MLTCTAKVKWLLLVSRTTLVFIEDWIPQRHCRYPIVFLSRWRASTVVNPGRTPRDENWSPHWAVTKLIQERKRLKSDTEQWCPLSAFHTYHLGVRLRNIFIPKRGPCVSPAPSSTCIHTCMDSHVRLSLHAVPHSQSESETEKETQSIHAVAFIPLPSH